MFSLFGNSQAAASSRQNVFDEDNIGHILRSFEKDFDAKNDGTFKDLILSTSKTKVVRQKELVQAIKYKLDNSMHTPLMRHADRLRPRSFVNSSSGR
jgi:hypothetical protein